jgi:hypothetical protein
MAAGDLTTLTAVQGVPGITLAFSATYIATQITAASQAVKTFLKRDITLTSYTEIYSGDNTPFIKIKQYPVQNVLGAVTGAAGNGGSPNLVRITVASTAGLVLGQYVSVQGIKGTTEANGTWITANLTATTIDLVGTVFANAWISGGIVLYTGVWFDPTGYGQQNYSVPGSQFAAGTLLTQGLHYILALDAGGTSSNRGLIQRISGTGGGSLPGGIFGTWGGYYNSNPGKLSASKLPSWPFGTGNLKVSYTAGFPVIPADLADAVTTLMVWKMRNQPVGGILAQESKEGYSYSIQQAGNGSIPELGTVNQTLKAYREVSI